MTQPLLSLIEVSKGFSGRKVIDRLSWSIEPGQCAVVLGESGAGKSVFLSLLLGFEQPDEGKVGGSLSSSAERFKRIAVVFQDDALLDDRSVEANLAVALTERLDVIAGPFGASADARIEKVLREVGLEPDRCRKLRPGQLSGGMRRRVALARALLREPELLIADEPTAGLDRPTAASIEALIGDLIKQRGMSTLIVTHDPECAAALGEPIYFFTPRAGGLKAFENPSEGPVSGSQVLAWIESQQTEAAPEVAHGINGLASGDPASPPKAIRERTLGGLLEGVDALGRAVLFSRYLAAWPSPVLFTRDRARRGLGSVGLTILVFALTGVVLEIQAESQISEFGFSNRLPELLAVAIIRLAPMIAAFLIAGRCGSALAAEVGWGVLSGQDRALRTMRIEPHRAIFPPLFWSWILVVPVIAAVGTLAAWASAWGVLAVARAQSGITARYFFNQLPESIEPVMIAGLLVKTVLMGAGLVALAYSNGAAPKRSATDVSAAITRTLVLSIIWISLIDAAVSLVLPVR